MKKFFNTIIGFFESLFDFVTNIVESLLTFLEVLETSLVLPPVLAGLVPGILTTAILSIVAIGVAKILTGR